MRPRRFLPRDVFDLRSDSRDAFGRGDDRLASATRTRFGLREPVGDRQPNRPDDVATVEGLLNSLGQPPFGADREPTGFFSVGRRDSIRNFQRQSGLRDDAIVTPDGETLDALNHEVSFDGDGAATEAECRRLAARVGNKQLQIERASEKLVALSDRNDAINREIEDLEDEARQGVVEGTVEGAFEGALEGATDPSRRRSRGRGIVGDVVKGAAEGAVEGATAGARARERIDELRDELARNVREIRRLSRELAEHQSEKEDLIERQRSLGCIGS